MEGGFNGIRIFCSRQKPFVFGSRIFCRGGEKIGRRRKKRPSGKNRHPCRGISGRWWRMNGFSLPVRFPCGV
ncbi:MAG: hypothetical protein C6W56_11225 [Caldibacillus debilis]|nr:MAG: hypothetical protein C6W56_11225 [Caldibacillus debilis]